MKRFILLSLLFLAVSIFAQESVKFVTYGPSAATKEGDNDHYQIIFFKVPTELADSFFVRIYDADVGDRNDTRFGDFDSRTRFSLYGGAGTYSKIFGDTSLITEMKTSGKLIKTEEFGNDPFKDNKWYNFQTLKAPDGESIDGFSYFKLIVEGISGDDANIFDLTISTDEKKNILPNNSEIFSFYPSIRLPNKGIYAELRFFVNENIDAVTVHNFDLASANLNVVTPFRSNLAIPSSRQDEWLEGTVEIQNNEKNNINALIFEGGNEIPNDATFYLTDQNKSLIPVKHPIYIHKPNNRPIPSASGKILSDCYTVVFDASNSSDRDDDALDFYWKFGDGSTGEGVRIAHTYPELKDYQIELIVRDGSGQVGNSSLFNFSVKLNNPPQADAGNDLTIAPGAIVEFSGINSKDVDGSVINYVWDFGEGTKKEGLTVNHIYQNTGNYKVTLRVEDDSDSPCNFDTDQINVWVNAQPSVDVGDDIIGSVNEELTFNGSRSSDSDGELINYEWDFGDGSSGTGEITTHKYSSPGYYNVQLTVYDNSGVSNQSASDRLTVYVNDRPKAFAGNDRVVAVGESVSFNGSNSTDDTKLIGYDWDFGDGNQSSGVAVSHAYEKPGKYIVELTVTDDSKSISDKSSDELTVVVNFPPISVPGEDMYVSQSVVQFDGSKSSDEDGEIVAYLWEFGDGQTSSEPKPLHTYNLPGTYNVKLSVTDDSKTSTQTTSNQMMVIVNAPPVANAGLDRIAMPGQSIDFDGSGSVDSDGNIEIVEWDFGDGETGTGSSVSHSYKDPGIYLVGLKVADNSGHNSATDFDYLTVNVNAPPVAIAGNDIITAPGMEVIFDGSNSYDSDNEVTSFEWSFSDELYTSKSASMKRSFEAPGIYTAKLKVFDNSGAENPYADDELTIFVNNRPQAVIGENILSCSPVIFFDGSKSVDADGDALIYTWDFGDGEQGATGINVSHTYKNSGTFPVILTVDDNKGLPNSTHSYSIAVTINEPPIANAGDDRTICAGDVVLFDGGASSDPEGGLIKYYWDFGDGTKAEGLNPTKVYDVGGVFQVTLSIKDDSGLECNSDMDQMVVIVAESPVADAGEDQVVCANSLVQFNGSKSRDFDGVVNSYTWDFGDGNTGGGVSPTHVYTEPGTYRILLTITGDLVGDCDNTDKDEVIVTVQKAGKADFDYKRFVEVGEVVTFDASSSSGEGASIIEYNWTFGDDSKGNGKEVDHVYTEPGKYFVGLTIETDSKAECSTVPFQDFIIVNGKPIANAGNDRVVSIDEQVVFNASESTDSDGSITNYEWNFGDGSSDFGVEVKHRYRAKGSYPVILKVIDDTDLGNNFDLDTLNVMVLEPEVISILSKNEVCVDEEVEFSASGSSINSDYKFVWKFGDGTTIEGQTVKHTFSNTGEYMVSLTTDDSGNMLKSKTRFSKSIKVNQAPVILTDPLIEVCPHSIIQFNASGSIDYDGEITKIEWDFGDGNKGEGEITTHQYSEPGIYDAKVTVWDNSNSDCNASSSDIKVVVNSTPIAVSDFNSEVYTGGAYDQVLFDASRSSDPDGDPLTFVWDFGDGEKGFGEKVYHKYLKAGLYFVKLTAIDDSGFECGKATIEHQIAVKSR